MVRLNGKFQQTCKQLRKDVIDKYEPVMVKIHSEPDNTDLQLVKYTYDTMIQGLEKFLDYPHDDSYAVRVVKDSVEHDSQMMDAIIRSNLNLVWDGTWRIPQYYQVFILIGWGKARKLVFESVYLEEAQKFLDNYKKAQADTPIYMETSTTSLLD